jgi:hypothetical protein
MVTSKEGARTGPDDAQAGRPLLGVGPPAVIAGGLRPAVDHIFTSAQRTAA